MKPHWILIASATHARLLRQESGAPIVVLKSFTHSQGSKFSELAGDAGSHENTFSSFGGTQPRNGPRRTEPDRLARELADDLERQARLGRYDSLAVFASSPFLGELKADLGPATARRLSGTHDMDLTNMGPAELERCIEHELAA